MTIFKNIRIIFTHIIASISFVDVNESNHAKGIGKFMCWIVVTGIDKAVILRKDSRINRLELCQDSKRSNGIELRNFSKSKENRQINIK